jgi:hypothetical protein
MDYPCKNETPKTCGYCNGVVTWNRDSLVCVYPNCLYGQGILQLVKENSQEINVDDGDFVHIKPGQKFEAIIYHGDDEEIARFMLAYLKNATEAEEPLILKGLPIKIKVLTSQVRRLDNTYEIRLQGEFV